MIAIIAGATYAAVAALARTEAAGPREAMNRPDGLQHWPADVWSDYAHAHIRLATLRTGGVQHLLFACVELLPVEVPPLPSYRVPKLALAGGGTAMASVTDMDVTDALLWYEAALSGAVAIPGTCGPILVNAVPLAPEPRLGQLVVAETPTVALQFSTVPRMHRLVPMGDPPAEVAKVLGPATEQTPLRAWLRDACFVDLATRPDCLGGVVLLAPDPIVRSVADWPAGPTAEGAEMIAVRVVPRAGRSLDTIRVRLTERRPDGPATVREVDLDEIGEGRVALPQPAWETAVEVVCSVRGLLSSRPHLQHLRSVGFTMLPVRSQASVEVPSRGRHKPGSHHIVPIVESGLISQSLVSVGREADQPAASRLALLLAARTEEADTGEVVFRDRAHAVGFVRELTRGATQVALFVDRYFGTAEVRELALAAWVPSCAVRILTGSEGVGECNDLLADLDMLKAGIPGRASPIEISVMTSVRFHDRFLVVDAAVWHFGDSFGSVGYGQVSMATRLRRPAPVRQMLDGAYAAAQPLADFLRRRDG